MEDIIDEDPTENSAEILYNYIVNEDKGKYQHKKGWADAHPFLIEML